MEIFLDFRLYNVNNIISENVTIGGFQNRFNGDVKISDHDGENRCYVKLDGL